MAYFLVHQTWLQFELKVILKVLVDPLVPPGRRIVNFSPSFHPCSRPSHHVVDGVVSLTVNHRISAFLLPSRDAVEADLC